MNLGASLPEFILNDQFGHPFSSASVKGKQAIVLFFYPKNFTPGCVKEACDFRDAYEDFKDLGAEVIGISADSDTSHQKFAAQYKLPYVLLADVKNKVRTMFDVQPNLVGLLPGRETFVFDKNGQLVFKFKAFRASKHIQHSLQFLQNMKHG